ncbi:amino acid ABC transporter permease [Camelimonas abortus]|uniref:Amino acid ABC transporter permease n=1 Tax=Camelimonas abortus TaxID=1017184 RepID=A0ABV7LDB3_9HYPH
MSAIQGMAAGPARGARLAQTLRGLVSSPLNLALTLLALALAWTLALPAVNFLLVDAVWSGADRDACLATRPGETVGACWPFIFRRIGYFVYGQYPAAERWRPDLAMALCALNLAWALHPRAPWRGAALATFVLPFPVVAWILLYGPGFSGLETVPTHLWGGVLVTLVISFVGIIFSLPAGILLALGRRSSMPAVRAAAIVFIEVMRGVPLIAVLFMANRMLPLFLPPGVLPDPLLRVMAGVCLFAAAGMAEVIRGGLQALPRGQYEAAAALGLGYWRAHVYVILPQALRLVLPGVVNTFISLLKDTTLVTVVGIFDLLTAIDVSARDVAWATPVTAVTGYAFAALFYFACCYAMSRYAAAMERRLAAGRRS